MIDPLFLDGLRRELEEIRGIGVVRTRTDRLKAFQEKLALEIKTRSLIQNMAA